MNETKALEARIAALETEHELRLKEFKQLCEGLLEITQGSAELRTFLDSLGQEIETPPESFNDEARVWH